MDLQFLPRHFRLITLIIIVPFTFSADHTGLLGNKNKFIESATSDGNFDYALKPVDMLDISRVKYGMGQVQVLDSTSPNFVYSIQNEVNNILQNKNKGAVNRGTIYLDEGGSWSSLTVLNVKQTDPEDSKKTLNWDNVIGIYTSPVNKNSLLSSKLSEMFGPDSFFYISTKTENMKVSDSGLAALTDAKGVREFSSKHDFEISRIRTNILQQHLEQDLLLRHADFVGSINSEKFRKDVTKQLDSDLIREIRLRKSDKYPFDPTAQQKFIENPAEFLKTNIVSGYEFTRLGFSPENGKEYNFGILRDPRRGNNYFLLVPEGGDIRGVWLSTQEQIKLHPSKGAEFIFTPQLEGCALYSKITDNTMKVFHYDRPGTSGLKDRLAKNNEFTDNPFEIGSHNLNHDELIREVELDPIKGRKEGYTSFLHPNEYHAKDEDFNVVLHELKTPQDYTLYFHSHAFMHRDSNGEWKYVVQPLAQKVSKPTDAKGEFKVLFADIVGETWVKSLTDSPVGDKWMNIEPWLVIEKLHQQGSVRNEFLTEDQKKKLQSSTCILSRRRRRRSTKSCVFYTSDKKDLGSADKILEIEGPKFMELLKSTDDLDADLRTKLIKLAEHVKITGDDATLKAIHSLIKVETESVNIEDIQKLSKNPYELFKSLLIDLVGTKLDQFAIDPMLIKTIMDTDNQLLIGENFEKEFGLNQQKETEVPDDQETTKANKPSFLEKSQKWKSRISYGLIGKDVLKGLIHNDIRSIGELGGRVTLGILASTFDNLITKGAEAYGTIGRSLLSNSMKVAGAFVGETVDIGFTIKSLVDGAGNLENKKNQCSAEKAEEVFYREIFEFKCNQDESQIVGGIVSDSLSLGLSAATIGFAATGYGAPVALVLGAVDLLVSLGSQIYNMVSEVAKFDKLIKLSASEKLALGWKLFWGYDDHNGLKQLVKSKETAHERVEVAVKFLEERQEFHSMFLSVQEDFDTVVKLDSKRYILYGRDTPDDPPRGTFICKTGKESSSGSYSYLCDNAVGLTVDGGRRNGSAIFKLRHGLGSITAVGYQDRNNVFVVDHVYFGDTQKFTGGPRDDTFILLWRQDDPTNRCGAEDFWDTVIEGNGGHDTMILDTLTTQSVFNRLEEVDMRLGRIGNDKLKFSGITQIVGKFESQEKIILACDTTFVDGNGGLPTGPYKHGKTELYRTGENDDILVPAADKECYKSVRIMLRNNTNLVNEATHGDFLYGIPLLGNVSVSINNKSFKNTKHVFEYLGPISSIKNVDFNVSSNVLMISDITGNEFSFETEIVGDQMNPSMNLGQERTQLVIDPQDGKQLCAVTAANTPVFKMKVLLNLRHVFIVTKLSKRIELEGGQNDDVFVLDGKGKTGDINGGLGRNTLRITNSDYPEIDLCRNRLGEDLVVSNIQDVAGSEQSKDRIIVGKTTREVDGQGGFNSSLMDEIVIRDGCESNALVVTIRNNTAIVSDAKLGHFMYLCPEINSNNFEFQMNYSYQNEIETRHFIQLAESEDEIESLEINEDSLLINRKLNIPLNSYSLKNNFYMDPSIETSNKIRLGLRKGHETRRWRKSLRQGSVIGIVSLGKGNFTKSGSQKMNNLFLCEDGYVNFTGGRGEDEFVLVGPSYVTGTLVGKSGKNTLTLGKSFMANSCISINEGSLTYSCNQTAEEEPESTKLEVRDINAIIGRPGKPEIVSCGCRLELESVDLKGGSEKNHDTIIVDASNCTTNLNVTLNSFTDFRSFGKHNGTVLLSVPAQWDYFIDNVEVSDVKLDTVNSAKHIFKLHDDLFALVTATLSDGRLVLRNRYNGSISIPLELDDGISEFFEEPRILVGDFEIKVGKYGTVFAFGEAQDDFRIDGFKDFATRSNITCYIRLSQNQNHTWIVGTSDTDLLTNDPKTKSTLIGNGGDNQYEVIGNSAQVDILVSEEDNKSILDLSHVVRANVLPEVTGQFPHLTLHVDNATVRLQNVLLYSNVLHNFSFEFGKRRMKLKRNLEDQWTFSPTELRVSFLPNESNKIAVISAKSLYPGTTIVLDNNGVVHGTQVMKKGDDLVFTTESDHVNNGTGEKLISLVISDYFNASEAQVLNAIRIVLKNSIEMNETDTNVTVASPVEVVIDTQENIRDFDETAWREKQEIYKTVLGIDLPNYESGTFILSWEVLILVGILAVTIIATTVLLIMWHRGRRSTSSKNIRRSDYSPPTSVTTEEKSDMSANKLVELIRYENTIAEE